MTSYFIVYAYNKHANGLQNWPVHTPCLQDVEHSLHPFLQWSQDQWKGSCITWLHTSSEHAHTQSHSKWQKGYHVKFYSEAQKRSCTAFELTVVLELLYGKSTPSSPPAANGIERHHYIEHTIRFVAIFIKPLVYQCTNVLKQKQVQSSLSLPLHCLFHYLQTEWKTSKGYIL